jgi:hypothetical protein
MVNRAAKYCAFIGGILLIISGTSGLAEIEKTKSFVVNVLKFTDPATGILFVFLLFLAALGGILVIIAGILFGQKKVQTGRFLITMGAGVVIVSLALGVLVAYFSSSPIVQIGSGIGFAGLILSIISGMLAE